MRRLPLHWLAFLAFLPGGLAAQDGSIGLQPVATPTEPAAASVSTAEPVSAGPNLLENLGHDRPWMEDLYQWNEAYNLDRGGVSAQKAGAYCVGNGHSFVLIGLESPLWDWSDIYGDSYQEPDLGHFQMALTRGGAEVRLAQQQIGWVRRSGLVRVSAQGNGLSVESYDFAPCQWNRQWADNPPAIIRLVHVVNEGSTTEDSLGVRFKVTPAWNVQAQFKGDHNDLSIVQRQAKAKRRTYWRLAAFDNHASSPQAKGLEDALPPLAPGAELWAAYFLSSADSPEDSDRLALRLRTQGAAALLDDTRDYYQKWFQAGAEFSGDPKLADLFEIQSLIYKCEQSHSGGFSPLIGYSYTWIRDNNGPIRWFLKTGHPQEAKGAIDFFHGVAASMGSLPNSIRVDYPLSYRLADLSGIHVEHAETPNWIILQHWWYYLSTGDLNTIRQRWPYLKRCLTGQVQAEGKYFFHRDETYLWCLESRVFDYETYPNYDLSTYAFATDSSFDFVAAADRLAYLGGLAGEKTADIRQMADSVRDTAEKTYWNDKAQYWAPAQSLLGPLYNAPYANILLNPLWCGYARNDLDPSGATPEAESKAVSALAAGYQWLGKNDGFWKTTPAVDFFVGMNPGQLLYDLCKARLPWAGKAFAPVLELASPSGDFSEMYSGQYLPWNPPVWGLGTSGRVRPWEGGLNTESLFEFVTGFAPDAGENQVVLAPHLPPREDDFAALRLPVGDKRISLELHRVDSDSWRVVTRLDQGRSLKVILDLWPLEKLIHSVESNGEAAWDKSVEDSKGLEARLHFTLAAGAPATFVVHEAGSIPDELRNPPAPRTFTPAPFTTERADILLLTSPSAVFSSHGHVAPANFLKVGREEWALLRKLSPSVSFLDLDLPISAQDVAAALLDDAGRPKVKLAVWGRGALSSGKHDFKPDSFWENPEIGKAFKKFLEGGGNVLIGPSYLDREIQPSWLVDLTRGGWEEGGQAGIAVPAVPAKEKSPLTFLDEVDVANAKSESDHGVVMEGALSSDEQKLLELPRLTKTVDDDGRLFKGFYQFTAKTEPGERSRVWVRVNTGLNSAGMALMVQKNGDWVQAGVRTKNAGNGSNFLTFYFEVPETLVTSTQTTFRLLAKNGEAINAYHLWVFGLSSPGGQALAEQLGFTAHQSLGGVRHGLIAQGAQWQKPVLLSRDPSQAALLVQKIGEGYLVRSELALEDSMSLMTVLMNHSLQAAPSPTAPQP
ncbi:MAG TPA: hypothetical protein VMU88_06960 [bacterium]|nr:hypothetical protein [bacterium]